MGRWIGGVLACVGGLIAVLTLLPFAFSKVLLRASVLTQIEARTGLIAEPVGQVTIAFLPTPHLTIKHLRLRDTTGTWSAEAKAVSGALRLTSLLAGRLDLDSLTLSQPRLLIELDAKPFGASGAVARALRLREGTPDAFAAESTLLGTLRIVGGTMRLTRRHPATETTIANIDAVLDWPSMGGAAELGGSAMWGGHQARFEATTASPLALLRGLPSQTMLRVRSDLADIDVAGSFADVPRERFVGTLRATTPSLRDLGRMTGIVLPLPGPLASASLAGEGSLTSGKLWLTGLKATLDGNAFEGSIGVLTGPERTAVSGTLATDLLQLDPIAAAPPGPRGENGRWSPDRLDLAALSRRDLDLRISAARARLGGAQLEDAAVSVLMKDGRLDISLAEAKAYGGNVRMRVVGRVEPRNAEAKLDASFANVDLAALFADASLDDWISGAASGSMTLESSGDSPATLVRGLKGTARIDVEAGDLIGIDLEKALRRVQKRPLLAATDIRSGRTAFDRLTLDTAVTSGVAHIREGSAAGPATRIEFAGSANLPERWLDVRASAAQTGSAGDGATPEFSFFIGGPWDNLYLEPDAVGLMRGSGAASPLFLSQHARIDGWTTAATPIALLNMLQ